jgi:FixJ family two-component response regulator
VRGPLAKQARYIVYIVDDDDAVRDSLAELLEIEGFEPKGYASCEEFLDHFHPASDACLLLDVRMPGMDGIELLETLGRRQHHLPVIVMSGNEDTITKARALRAGAATFLDKPLNVDQLMKSIEAVRG